MVGVESAVRPAFSGCQCTPDPAALSARHVRALRLRIRRCWSTASWQLGVYGSESTHHIESLARWVPAPARAMRAGGVREGRRGDRTWFLVLTPALGACRMTAAERTNGETAVRSAIWRRAAAGTGRQRLRGGRPPAQRGCPSNEHHGGLGKRVRMDALATIGWFQLLFDEGGGVGGVDRHLHHVQLAGVPTCAAASTLTHTAAGVGEGRGQ